MRAARRTNFLVGVLVCDFQASRTEVRNRAVIPENCDEQGVLFLLHRARRCFSTDLLYDPGATGDVDATNTIVFF